MSYLKKKAPASSIQKEGIEFASRDEISDLQLRRLKETLNYVYRKVPHYREEFDNLGIHPSDLKELGDIAKFPLTDKETLRSNYPFGMSGVNGDEIARVHASSGTTGSPTIVTYTKRDLEIWSELVARSLRAGGVYPGDKVQIAFGYGLFTGGLGCHYGVEKLGAAAIPISGGNTQKQLQIMNELRPDAILGTPSYILKLLDDLRDLGVDPQETSLRTGVFGAEPWSEKMRSDLEQGFEIDATDIYGLSEIMGPGVAQECIETKDGLTIWEDIFYPEILDTETLEPVPDGEFGELVITPLAREASPTIRFRTRDITRLLPGTARSMRRLDRIVGRSDDMIIIRGVNCFPSQFGDLITSDDCFRSRFQCILTKRGHLDHLTLVVEHAPDRTSIEVDQATTRLRNRVKDKMGISVEVDARSEVFLGQGKAKYFVDNR
ncbi:Phenylacetate-coenzyme A ligase [Corynebacterium casei]|uniref:AMP-binding protein n=1 Tax=Corynebacterium casei TaxID=160386 RepID=UPI0009CFA3DE|nr:AMP-binding protein [Corynebacterium casei]SLM93178.1 Phenylacetate-coenzyme A ligase [Corynebacterium casei]